MTVNTTKITSGPFVGNGIADTFSYTFKVEDKTQLSVFETTDNGVETLLTVDTDYTVNGIGVDGGGTILRIAGALPTDFQWFIRSNYQETQLTAFGSQGPFFPDIHENAMDKLTFLVQQLLDEKDRSPSVSPSYTGSLPLSLANPVAQALLRWKSDLSGLENVFPASLSPPVILSDQIVLNGTLAGAKADVNVVAGSVYIFGDRGNGKFDVVAGVAGADGWGIIAHDTLNISFVLDTTDVANAVHFGAVSGQQSAGAIQAAINTSLPVYLPEGDYLTNVSLTRVTDSNFTIFGPGTITNIVSDTILKVSNPVKVTTTLTVAPVTKSLTFTLASVTGILTGDLMIIKSTKLWDDSNTNWIAGEILTVRSVLGLIVTATSESVDNYLIGDTVRFYRPANVLVRDISIKGDATGVVVNGQEGLVIENFKNPYLENLVIKDTSKVCIKMSECLGGQALNCDTDSEPLFAGFAYGINISSTCNFTVNGGTYRAGRHGITHGGSFPARHTTHNYVIVDSHRDTSPRGFDTHGNTEFTIINHCLLRDGFAVEGRNHIFEGTVSKGLNSVNISPKDYHPDQYCKFIDCELVGLTGTDNTLQIQSHKEFNDDLFMGRLIFERTITLGTSTLPVIVYKNDFEFTTIEIEKIQYSKSPVIYNGSTANSFAIDGSTNFTFDIGEHEMTDGSDITTNRRVARFAGVSQGGTKVIRFKDSVTTSTNTDGVLYQASDSQEIFEILGMTYNMAFSGGGSTISVDKAIFKNCTVKGITSDIFNFSGSGELLTTEIYTPVGVSASSDPVKTYFSTDGVNVIGYSDAAPTDVTVAWKQGDVLRRKTLTSASPHTRFCIADGSPGTWSTSGNVT